MTFFKEEISPPKKEARSRTRGLSLPPLIISAKSLYQPICLSLHKMKFESGYSTDTLKNSVLLVPSVSMANIPQLASDVLLHSLDFMKVATLSDEYLFPFVSPIDHSVTSDPPRGISFALEVFYCETQNISLIQQRAPLMPGFAARHVSEVIMPFVSTCGFKHVVVLHSSDAGLAREVFPGDIQVFTSEDVLTESLRSLKISKTSTDPSEVVSHDTSPYAKSLVDKISKFTTLSLMIIYAYEGDNLYDAQVMSRKIAEFLSLDMKEWQTPVSWSGVYGDKPVPSAMEEGMYG